MNTISSEQLRTTCQLMFGEHWRGPAAKALNVPYDKVKQWDKNRSRIPPGIGAELVVMLDQHAQQVARARGELAAAVGLVD